MLILATERYLAIELQRRRGTSTFVTEIDEARAFLDWSGKDDEAFIHNLTTAVEWRTLKNLEAVDPWPSFSIAGRRGRVGDSRVYQPWPSEENLAEWEAAVVGLFEHAGGRDPDLVQLGWLEAPEVDWEKVKSWPSDAPAESGYRKAAKERIVAKRAKGPKSFFGEPDPLADCVTTETHLYARWHEVVDAWRVPLSTLRLGSAERDARYTFGRRVRFSLKHREDCPVRKHLDSLLA